MNDILNQGLNNSIEITENVIKTLEVYNAALVQIEYDEMILQLKEVLYDLEAIRDYNPLFMKHAKYDD